MIARVRAAGFAALLLAAGSIAVPAREPENDGQRLMAEYGLLEDAEPVRKRAGWRVPRRIVVDGGLPELVEAVRAAAPRVEVVATPSIAEMAAAAASADIVMGRSAFVCSDQVLAAGKDLRWAQTVYAGVELCARQSAFTERGVILTNMRAIGAPVIAEHAIGLMLALSRGLPTWFAQQSRAVWNQSPPDNPMVTIKGKTLLVVGLGGIGSEVAQRAHALGLRVIATRASRRDRPPYVALVGTPEELPTLIGQADFVVNAAPLTPATRQMFNAALFSRMKRSAFFINVGRGGTVVTSDLVEALQKKQLAGAGLDVFDPEPLPADHPLWRLPNVVVTPHVAGSSDLGAGPELRVVRENLRRYLAGERLLSVVDVARGY